MSPHSLVGSHIDGPPSYNGVVYAEGDGIHADVKTNGHGSIQEQSLLRAAPRDEVHDLICIGFGPASLAIAVALHDAIENGKLPKDQAPKVLFLEKQGRFAWHAGMLLPGAKMQISFVKDLATLRDPRSHFTFMNFLHKRDRLVEFTNLNTFLPARAEFEEYLRWCAGHFGDVVQYGQEAVAIAPVATSQVGQPISQFTVQSRNIKTGDVSTFRATNVLVAAGGQPKLPQSLPAAHPRVVHSSQYAHLVPKILSKRDAPYRVAVIGGGQSAAEIFNNIQDLYPNSRTYMVMRQEFLKPSDDSPFVNSIFDPSFIDTLYPRSSVSKKALITDAKATNYGVVRLELIEHLYEKMYEQRREFGNDERDWPHRILGATDIVGVESDDFENEKLRLRLRSLRSYENDSDGDLSASSSIFGSSDAEEFSLDVDLIVAGTGYQRRAHLNMMDDAIADLLPDKMDGFSTPPEASNVAVDLGIKKSRIESKSLQVARDYSVRFAPQKVSHGSGLWLQGCNEGTHGLSDTLLSVLATRSDEIVNSIFAHRPQKTYTKQ